MSEKRVYRGPGVIDRVRFLIERLLMRGLRYRLLFAALVVGMVAVVSGEVARLLDPELGGSGDAIWWAFLRLTDPGYLGDDEGTARRVVSTIVTVLGYLLFLGLLVAILTQWLNRELTRLESGVTPVALSNHFLILGWTRRTARVVEGLLGTGPRMRRFLRARGARAVRIVILAEQVDQALIEELMDRLGELWDDRRVLVRSGSPLRLEHLERVWFREAAVIILPGADFGERDPDAVDAQVVKTLKTVSAHAGSSVGALPLVVGTIYDPCKTTTAMRVYEGECQILAVDEVVSRFIAQSIREPGLCAVINELFTLNVGNALYVRSVEGQAGLRYSAIASALHEAVLIGLIPRGSHEPIFNPDPDSVVDAEDLLVLIARNHDDCRMGADDEQAVEEVPPAADLLPDESDGVRRVLILGWSRRVPVLLRELDRAHDVRYEFDIVGQTDVETRSRLIAPILAERRSVIRNVEADISIAHVLEELGPGKYDTVYLPARERFALEEQADASTVLIHSVLDNLLDAGEGPRPQVVVELLDEDSEFLFKKSGVDVIVGPKLVSYLQSQVTLRPELAYVSAGLAQPDGHHIRLRPAHEILTADGPVRYEQIRLAVAAFGEVALGVVRGARRADTVLLNPSRELELTLESDDRVVVLDRRHKRPSSGRAG